MELIPAPPTSADHTVFMASLKESHTGDYMTSRRDDTRPKCEHVISAPMATCGLDENASPNPQPMPTMVILQFPCSYLIMLLLYRPQHHQGAVMDHCVSVYWMVRGEAHVIT